MMAKMTNSYNVWVMRSNVGRAVCRKSKNTIVKVFCLKDSTWIDWKIKWTFVMLKDLEFQDFDFIASIEKFQA